MEKQFVLCKRDPKHGDFFIAGDDPQEPYFVADSERAGKFRSEDDAIAFRQKMPNNIVGGKGQFKVHEVVDGGQLIPARDLRLPQR